VYKNALLSLRLCRTAETCSDNVRSFNLVLQCQVLHCQALKFGLVLAGLAFSTPAI